MNQPLPRPDPQPLSTTSTTSPSASSTAAPLANASPSHVGSSAPSAPSPIYIPPASAQSNGLSGGSLFAVIFVPIVVVSLLASGCLFFLVRRRRRARRSGTRELKHLHQDSVEQLSSGGANGRQSRSLTPFSPGLSPDHGPNLTGAGSAHRGPLMTVDGPSYGRTREDPPPPYKTGGATGGSPGSRSPPRLRSSQLSEANLAMHQQNGRSPFADPEDDLVSEVSEHGERHVRARDGDRASVVSDVSDVAGRHATVPRRAL